jgi:hypothetical protein
VSSKPPGILDPLRVRLRRLQFVVGLGFLSLVIGSVLTVSLTVRLSGRVQSLPWESLQLLIAVMLEHLWVLGVLPLLCYGVARILELKPLSTAVGAVLSGELFVLALYFVRDGFEGFWTGWFYAGLRFIALAAGVLLTYRAVVLGRAAAAQGSVKAEAQAAARTSEYSEFLREAERGAERSAQREAERAAAAASAPAAVEAPAPESPQAAGDGTPGETKAPTGEA